MVCARCGLVQYLGWHIDRGLWELLPRRWWRTVLHLECYLALVDRRVNRRVLFGQEDFRSRLVIGGRRVRGFINRPRAAFDAHKTKPAATPAPERASTMRSACECCWYIAWVPIEDDAECALVHPHEGDHIRCDYCWLKARQSPERASTGEK